MEHLANSGPSLRVLTRSDLADIELPPEQVIRAVEDGYLALESGASRCPTKMMIDLPVESRDSIAFSMLGFDAARDLVGYKTSYRKGSDNRDPYYTTITLYDDETGLPYALMDCQKIGASRTPATTALIARECARSGATSVTMLGTGLQSMNTLAYLLTVLPNLQHLRLHGTHPEGIKDTLGVLQRWFPDRSVELIGTAKSLNNTSSDSISHAVTSAREIIATDADAVREAVSTSDITVVASGRAWHPKIHTSWIPEGGLLISVASKGVADGAVAEADRVIATSKGQFDLVGQRLLQGRNVQLDATLPDILAGQVPGRISDSERIFAFCSGMIVTDIPIAHELAVRAFSAGRGSEVTLWS